MFMKFLRIIFVVILVASAVFSIIIMFPFLLLYWWVWARDERIADEMVRAALARRSAS